MKKELPRVHLREDADGNIHLRNLSAHPYSLPSSLLFSVCFCNSGILQVRQRGGGVELPVRRRHQPPRQRDDDELGVQPKVRLELRSEMKKCNNERSHCIFTIFITASKIGSDTVRRSKIHLVDLAGSERVHKSQVTAAI